MERRGVETLTEEHAHQRVCPHCESTHLDEELTMIFRGSFVHAIDTMAKRRHESVEQFIVHLLWLEAGKVKGLRALMEQASQAESAR